MVSRQEYNGGKVEAVSERLTLLFHSEPCSERLIHSALEILADVFRARRICLQQHSKGQSRIYDWQLATGPDKPAVSDSSIQSFFDSRQNSPGAQADTRDDSEFSGNAAEHAEAISADLCSSPEIGEELLFCRLHSEDNAASVSILFLSSEDPWQNEDRELST